MVLGLDRSEAMLLVAARNVPTPAAAGRARNVRGGVVAGSNGKLRFLRADGSALPLAGSVDAVFSTATLHWIGDHDAVFRSVFDALGAGGRFVSQCGGGRNLSRLYGRAADLMRAPAYAPFFDGWRDPWHFAFPDETRAALERAGFEEIEVWLESAPAAFPDAATYAEFIRCVCIRHHLARLPPSLHDGFASELTRAAASDNPPLTLDYWRLNITARRPAA